MPEQIFVPRDTVFVAREHELAQLNDFLDKVLVGQGQVVFVIGEAGSGKTALLSEFARRAQGAHDDLLVAIGDCNAQTGIGDPYLPFREVLGLLTGDMAARLAQGAITTENAGRLREFLRVSGQALLDFGPDLIEAFVPGAGLATRAGAFFAGQVGWLDRLEQLTERKSARPYDTVGRGHPARGTMGTLSTSLEQSDFFAQYTDVLKALASQRPLMLVVDDLQWADTASIALLFHLGRRFGESRIMLVGAYRPDEVALGRGGERHPLERVLAEFKRYLGDVWVDLDQAEEAEGQQFVDAFLDAEPNRLGLTFRQALFRHTGGHPLFTVELLCDLQEQGALVQDEKGRWVEEPALEWGTLPVRVEGVIEERIGRLEEELREILAVASVEGGDFTAQIVARVQGIGERQLVRTLSQELVKRHRLVQELGVVTVGRQRLFRYQFVHAQFQQYLYNGLGIGERMMLHGEIAEVLEELYRGATEEITVHLARHYAEAGEAEKAVHYLLQAGDWARGLYAHQEAIDYYERALAFLKEQGEHERAARTLMKLGLTYHIAFDYRRARQAYEEGFALWQRAGETEPAITLPAPHALRVDWGDPPTLDPAMAADVNSTGVIEQIFSGLVQLTPELDVVPDVARTWTVSEGGRRYVFHLRDDVVWSDGTSVTAHDFEYAWKRVLHPATGSPNAGLLYDVKGARAFHQGERPDPGRVGVRALDEVTLVVDLEEPTGHFPHLLACSATYPVPRHVSQMGSQKADIVTNGPFRLGTWQRGESMVLVRNPDRRGASVRQNGVLHEYHGRFTGNVGRVELSLLPDTSTKLEMYETDDLDTIHLFDLPPRERDRARQRHAGEYVLGPRLVTMYVGFDLSRPPFDDPRVRQAFVLATDRETLADVVMRGYSFPATGGFVPPGMPGHSAGIGLLHDPQQARRLLAEAGYPGERGFPAVDFLTLRRDDPVSEYLGAQWRGDLGIEVEWQTADVGTYLNRLETEPPHMSLSGWLADYPDPDNFLRVSPHVRYTHWRNAAYDRLVEGARRAMDQDERMQLYGQADRLLIEEAVIMPLTYGRWHMLVKPWVRKYPTSAIRTWFWKDVIIEPH